MFSFCGSYCSARQQRSVTLSPRRDVRRFSFAISISFCEINTGDAAADYARHEESHTPFTAVIVQQVVAPPDVAAIRETL
jgi:hypothetical protein